MLNDAAVSQFKKVYLAPGYTDLRRGIDGLASIVRFQFELDPYDKNTLFLFCARKNIRLKALLWEGDDEFNRAIDFADTSVAVHIDNPELFTAVP